jgi:hypothetical protein
MSQYIYLIFNFKIKNKILIKLDFIRLKSYKVTLLHPITNLHIFILFAKNLFFLFF